MMGTGKIMIVEDNALVAEDYRNSLQNFGYKVTSIQTSGEEAVKQAETDQPDIVLMDIKLDGIMDGIEAAEQIYARFKIAVVFISAFSDSGLLKRARQVGSFGYLIKPFKKRELYATLEMALHKVKIEKKQKQMEAQIRLLQELESIGTLAGGLAHDFNNFLFIILGNIELAEDNLQCGNSVSENLEEAKNTCFRAKELTKKLITFSKGGSPVIERISIGELVRDMVISTFEGSDIQTELSIPNDIKQIEADINQIKQVVNNIAVNAKEAMFNKGVFKVCCENIDIPKDSLLTLTEGEYIKISFKDQGCGITKQNINKIFEPYFSTKDMGVNKGQGLGLAICHSIMTRHNGIIIAESESGAGAEFTCYLPAFEDKTPDLKRLKEASVAQEPVKQSASGKHKIIVMDDEEILRNFMEQMLNRLGYDVETCIEGNDTLEKYKKAMESKEPFDIVILDLTNKFGMGGKETMKRLLEIDSTAKGIVITGYSDHPVVANYKAYGFSGFLTKPSTRDQLSKVINEVL